MYIVGGLGKLQVAPKVSVRHSNQAMHPMADFPRGLHDLVICSNGVLAC
jgi:hypothetical protein